MGNVVDIKKNVDEGMRQRDKALLKKVLLSSVLLMHSLNKMYIDKHQEKSGVAYATFDEDEELKKAYDDITPEFALIQLESVVHDAILNGVLSKSRIEGYASELGDLDDDELDDSEEYLGDEPGEYDDEDTNSDPSSDHFSKD